MPTKQIWYQITLIDPPACFGITVKDFIVVKAAPMGAWMVGKNINHVSAWVSKKGGKIQKLSP